MSNQNIEKLSKGHYIVNGIEVAYSRSARYDLFDGRYHPGWMIFLPSGVKVVLTKEDAFKIASSASFEEEK